MRLDAPLLSLYNQPTNQPKKPENTVYSVFGGQENNSFRTFHIFRLLSSCPILLRFNVHPFQKPLSDLTPARAPPILRVRGVLGGLDLLQSKSHLRVTIRLHNTPQYNILLYLSPIDRNSNVKLAPSQFDLLRVGVRVDLGGGVENGTNRNVDAAFLFDF